MDYILYLGDFKKYTFCILINKDRGRGAEQHPWLIKNLQENNNTWTITMGHKPAFGSGSQNGNEHSYERTWSLKDGKIDTKGVTYITNGCAGDEIYPEVRTWLTARAEGSPCYMVLPCRVLS